MSIDVAVGDTVIVRGTKPTDVYNGRVVSVREQDVIVLFDGTLGRRHLRLTQLSFVDGRWEASLPSLARGGGNS